MIAPFKRLEEHLICTTALALNISLNTLFTSLNVKKGLIWIH